MYKVLKYSEFNKSDDMSEYFLDTLFNPPINESISDSKIKSITKKLATDLKFNFKLVLVFGVGVRAMYPVVENLIKNGKIDIEMSMENIILLCITSIAITYLDESDNKTGDVNVTKKDAQTMLTELKLRGVGNGIVKKIVEGFKAIGKFFKEFFKKTPIAINGLISMFGYTSILIPAMNAISAFVGKYDITIESLAANLLSLGIGASSFLATQGVNYLINKLKKSLNVKGLPNEIKDVDIRQDISDGETDNVKGKLIKERETS